MVGHPGIPLVALLAAAGLAQPSPAGNGQQKQVMHIADLDDEMGGSGGGVKIQGKVGIWVHDSAHRPAANVIVRASWSGAVIGTTRCTTDEQGYCQMLSREFTNEQGITLSMSVRGYDNPEYDFDKKANHENDGDSDGTTIRIQR
ncbi:MAG: hypothetical protein R2882_11395 [Gemmatimonadales bacterium]